MTSDAGWYRLQTKAIGTITPSGNIVVERVTAAILADFPEVSGHFSRIPFSEFARSLAPAALVGLAINFGIVSFGFRKVLRASDVVRQAGALEMVDVIVPDSDIKPYTVEGIVVTFTESEIRVSLPRTKARAWAASVALAPGDGCPVPALSSPRAIYLPGTMSMMTGRFGSGAT